MIIVHNLIGELENLLKEEKFYLALHYINIRLKYINKNNVPLLVNCYLIQAHLERIIFLKETRYIYAVNSKIKKHICRINELLTDLKEFI